VVVWMRNAGVDLFFSLVYRDMYLRQKPVGRSQYRMRVITGVNIIGEYRVDVGPSPLLCKGDKLGN